MSKMLRKTSLIHLPQTGNFSELHVSFYQYKEKSQRSQCVQNSNLTNNVFEQNKFIFMNLILYIVSSAQAIELTIIVKKARIKLQPQMR